MILPPGSCLRSVDVSREVCRVETDDTPRWEESIHSDVITVDSCGEAESAVPAQSIAKSLMRWKPRLTPFLELLCEHRYFGVFCAGRQIVTSVHRETFCGP